MSGWLAAGRVGRPHGLDGSFHVTRPRAALLTDGAAVRIGERDTRVTRRAGTAERPILRVEAATSREAVEALRGSDILCPRAAAPELGADEWWAEELEGCAVRDGERPVGRVRELLGLPSCEALIVTREGGGELIVPMVRDAIRAVDVAARSIDVDLAFLGEDALDEGRGETGAQGDRKG
jgi:16S rRNA processing protein RimM